MFKNRTKGVDADASRRERAMKGLQEFKDQLAVELYGKTVREAQAEGLCIQCKEPALEKCYSAAGRREYRISGLCEKCFDSITGEEDEPDENDC